MKHIPNEKQIEELLASFPPTTSNRLDQRLSSAPWLLRTVARHRIIRASALVFLTVALLISITPQGQAFAQNIIRTIGNFVITDKASNAENYVATLQSGTPTPTVDPNWVCMDCQEPMAASLLTISQATAKAGFPVYELKHVPDGYRLSSRDVLIAEGSITADTSYQIGLDPLLHDGLQMRGIIALDQLLVSSDAQPWEIGVGNVPFTDITVHGQPGVWLEQIPIIPFQDPQGEWDYARWNQLIWTEDGYSFMLQTNMPSDILSLGELLEVAESLAP